MTDDQLREAMMASAPPKKGNSAWNCFYRPKPRIDHGKVIAMKADGVPVHVIAKRVSAKPDSIRQILRTHRLNGGAA